MDVRGVVEAGAKAAAEPTSRRVAKDFIMVSVSFLKMHVRQNFDGILVRRRRLVSMFLLDGDLEVGRPWVQCRSKVKCDVSMM